MVWRVCMWAHCVVLVARSGKHGICEPGEVWAATGRKLLGNFTEELKALPGITS